MKMYHCNKCNKDFVINEEQTNLCCPNCQNVDCESFTLLSLEEANEILKKKQRIRNENIFHIILFSTCAIVIVVLTIIIKLL